MSKRPRPRISDSPTPIKTGMRLLEPRSETKMTVPMLPISYMEAMMPEMEEGISYRFSIVVITELM